MIKVLFLKSNPEGTPPLKLDEEVRLITQKIRDSEYRDVLKLETLRAVRTSDLLQALNEHQPQIVHFSGHGSQLGEIVLMDNNRQAKPVSAEALKMLFTSLKKANIRVVVLNACFSQIQAEAIAEVVDCVIGMSAAIRDSVAITFAASFYSAIGFGCSIKEAFDQGKTAITLEGIPGTDTPQLLTRTGVDPASLVLIESGENEAPVVAAAKIAPQTTSNIQERLEAIEKLKKVVRPERIIYTIVGCFFATIFIITVFITLFQYRDIAILLVMFGSGGMMAITAGFYLRMWDRYLKFIAPELRGNE
jgi:hypothetical protein